MKRYFGLFTKNQNSVVHTDNSKPTVIAEVVDSTSNVTPNEVTQVVEPDVHANEESVKNIDADKPKRRRRKAASDSPSDAQEVGDK